MPPGTKYFCSFILLSQIYRHPIKAAHD
uniref:Uncharacterized protein n=1 Tax=Arundo donax TaxID=35708 RepID=A0A0A9BSV1_ARUDO